MRLSHHWERTSLSKGGPATRADALRDAPGLSTASAEALRYVEPTRDDRLRALVATAGRSEGSLVMPLGADKNAELCPVDARRMRIPSVNPHIFFPSGFSPFSFAEGGNRSASA